jgi:hypothetical protein
MYHQDFILRQIEQLSKAIQRILNYHRSGRIDDAYELLNSYYQSSIGFLSDQLKNWEPEAFLNRLETKGFEAVELEALSQLTEAEGQMLEVEDEQDQAQHRYQLTFMLLTKAAEKDAANFSLQRQSRLNALSQKLDKLP